MTKNQFVAAVTTVMVLGIMQAAFAQSIAIPDNHHTYPSGASGEHDLYSEESVADEPTDTLFQDSSNPLEVRIDLRYGESIEEMIQAQVCSFTHFPDQLGNKRYMGCYDFEFYNDEIEAGMIFVDNALKQFVLFPQMSSFDAIINDLERFYGTPSSISPPSYFVDVDTKPNASAHIGFDHDTVILELHSDSDYEQSLRLYYLAKE